MGILIKNTHLDSGMCDIYIEGEKIHEIGSELTHDADTTIDAGGMAAIPPFVNVHTHAAMTLLRGMQMTCFCRNGLKKRYGLWKQA